MGKGGTETAMWREGERWGKMFQKGEKAKNMLNNHKKQLPSDSFAFFAGYISRGGGDKETTMPLFDGNATASKQYRCRQQGLNPNRSLDFMTE